MKFSASRATRTLLAHTSPEVRRSVLRAGAPTLLSALDELARDPREIFTLSDEDAALVVFLLEDPDLLVKVAACDSRPSVHHALLQNPHVPPGTLEAPVHPLLPTDIHTLDDLLEWVSVHRPLSREFCQWLVESSPDPKLFLEHYAQGNFGEVDPEVLFFLQGRPEVMALEAFFLLLSSTDQRAVLDQVVYHYHRPWDAPLVRFLQDQGVTIPFLDSCTPAARALLAQSARRTDQAVALAIADEPDTDLYATFSPDLQAGILRCSKNPDHQVLYARLLRYDDQVNFNHDPTDLLRRDHLDFEGYLNILRWATGDEIFGHLHHRSYSRAELQTLVRMVLSEEPHVCTKDSWMEYLNDCDPSTPTVADLVDITVQEALGLVGTVLQSSAYLGSLHRRVIILLEEHCQGNVAHWESVLSLGPTWEGTLADLLECVGLTDTE